MTDTPESQPNDGPPIPPEHGWAPPGSANGDTNPGAGGYGGAGSYGDAGGPSPAGAPAGGPPPNPGWVPPPPPSGWDGGWRDPSAAYPPPPAGAGGGPYYGGAYPPPGGSYGNAGPYGYWQPQWGAPGDQETQGWYGWGQNRPRRSLPGTVTALLLAVAVLVGLGIGHSVWGSSESIGSTSGNGSSGGLGFGGNSFGGSGSSGGLGFGGSGSGSDGPGSGSSGAVSAAAASASDDLVDIDTLLSYEDGEAAGTGIVLSANGYILTNNHVISGATTITATDIANGQKYTATVVGYDRTHDVAVIKLENASGLKVASIGNSSQVSDNETVVGLGNAGGVGGTPSEAPGQVTDLDQSITAEDESNGTSEKLSGLIETDCNIQPGDSGGALIDSSGQVVGMDTAASTGFSFETQGNQGFAIPINEAISIADQIRAGRSSQTVHLGDTAFLGVEIDTSEQAQGTSGAVVSKPISGGPAAAAGITAGDVITALGGHTVDSASTLTNLIGGYHPGDQVSITWLTTTGQTQTATVVLANGPAA